MSSTNANQSQSAESLIAPGLTFSLADVEISAPKMNKSGGKSANVLYKPTKKGLYINMQVPFLTWGASMFKDPQSGKETYDMAIQFPRKDYSTPETDKMLEQFQALENYIKTEATKNSMAWFNRKTMTPEVVDALWTPMLKYAKDQETGEPDMTKAPTLKVKMPVWEGKFNCEVYDPVGNMLYPDEQTGMTPMDLIPKGVNIVAIVQCGGLWFANGKFGCTWRLFQAVVQPKPSMKGRCLISVSSAEKNALAEPSVVASSVEPNDDEAGVEVEDDSDTEDHVAAPVVAAPAPVVADPAPVVAPPAPVVAAPAPVVEVAKTPVVKKKVVRKKE